MSNRLQDTHDSIEDARTALQESTSHAHAMHTACTRPAHDVRAHAMQHVHVHVHVHVACTCLSTPAQLYAKYRELSAKGTLEEKITNLPAAPVDSGACPRRRQRRIGPCGVAEGSGHSFTPGIAA